MAITNPFNRPVNPFTSVINFFRKPNRLENPSIPLSTGIILSQSRNALSPYDTGPDAGALSYGPVFAAERIIAEAIAGLPLYTYKRDGEDRKIAMDHALYALLRHRPNDYQTPYVFWDYATKCAIRKGNSFSYIERTNGGDIANLVPLDPKAVKIEIRDGEKVFVYGYKDGEQVPIPNRDILHLMGFSKDGLVGIPICEYASHAIALGLAAEAYSLRWFTKGSNPSGVFGSDTKLDNNQVEQIKNSLQAFEGIDNAYKSIVLPHGVKQVPGTTNEQAQLLEIRKFQITEIARIFRIPPHMLADLEKATFSNIENQSQDFIDQALRPWLVQFEQEINAKLLDNGEDYFAEFCLDELLRGDTKTRFDAWNVAIQGGWMTINEVRRKENMAPIKGGDVPRVPLNMGPAVGTTPPAPPPEAEPDDNAEPDAPSDEDKPNE